MSAYCMLRSSINVVYVNMRHAAVARTERGRQDVIAPPPMINVARV